MKSILFSILLFSHYRCQVVCSLEELMEELGWKVGDKLDYQMKDGSVYVTNLSLKERKEC